MGLLKNVDATAQRVELFVHRFERLRDEVPVASAIVRVSEQLWFDDVKQNERFTALDGGR